MSQDSRKQPMTQVFETSAGGFVLSSAEPDKVALIGRDTRSRRIEWCVPKGHPEGDETLEQAAVREIYEETGLHADIIVNIGSINYRFMAGDKQINKTVHHFLFQQIGGELTTANDPNHEAITAKWVGLDELSSILTHENEKRMAALVIEWVNKNQ